METIEYRTMDKSKWRDGPWQNEPDKKQWQDADTKMPCLIVRNNVGALCGYVGVAKDHPLFGVSHDETHPCLVQKWQDVKDGDTGKRGVFTIFLAAMNEDRDIKPKVEMVIDVHGSLTFSGACMKPNPAYPHITPEIVASEGICHIDPENDDVWWFGFDCGHCDDWSPKLYGEDIDKSGHNPFLAHYGKDMIYRDLAYVTAEVESLAKQLKALA